MTKKVKSTCDEFINSLTPKQKKEFEEEYKELLLSELLIATKYKDWDAIHKLTEAAAISQKNIQGLRSE